MWAELRQACFEMANIGKYFNLRLNIALNYSCITIDLGNFTLSFHGLKESMEHNEKAIFLCLLLLRREELGWASPF